MPINFIKLDHSFKDVKKNMYEETDKQGDKIIRWDTNKKYTKEELKQQREEFEEQAQKGKKICLTDLFINHGL